MAESGISALYDGCNIPTANYRRTVMPFIAIFANERILT
jgi:hypothetical protein